MPRGGSRISRGRPRRRSISVNSKENISNLNTVPLQKTASNESEGERGSFLQNLTMIMYRGLGFEDSPQRGYPMVSPVKSAWLSPSFSSSQDFS